MKLVIEEFGMIELVGQWDGSCDQELPDEDVRMMEDLLAYPLVSVHLVYLEDMDLWGLVANLEDIVTTSEYITDCFCFRVLDGGPGDSRGRS